MGLLNSALHIGRNAILGTQNALQIIGGNVSGAASPDFTRLTPQLDPLQGTLESEGVQPGAGVALTGIRRHIDEALESRLRISIGEVESAAVRRDALSRLESLFDDVSGTGLGTQLETFLHSFDDLSNSPENPATRDLVVAAGEQRDVGEVLPCPHGRLPEVRSRGWRFRAISRARRQGARGSRAERSPPR